MIELSPRSSPSFSTSISAILVAVLTLLIPFPWHLSVAQAALIPPTVRSVESHIQSRQTSICKRWAGQSALVNGTVYYVGGRVTTSASQNSNTWTNQGVMLDLTKSWDIGSPQMTAMSSSPSGLPAVSLGYLWSSFTGLFLYGGEFSDNPSTPPTPFSLWSYDIRSSSWTEHKSPKLNDGTSVQRAAEGAGVSIPGRGIGLYLGGHLDMYTTNGWSNQIARRYLPTMLEYTMPGYTSPGSDGSYRNISTPSPATFPERADGAMVYIPGFSPAGIVVALAGGTNTTFTQMNVLDVYDVASSTWYKQAVSGPTPDIRVNPCAVVTAAADGSSYNVLMYGGQNLIPYNSQTQFDDMWILTIPSFTWIKVDQTNQAKPPARAGHMCHVWNGQMIVIGGYVGQQLSCDTPGVYVFNASALQWQNNYAALGTNDPLNRQIPQQNDSNAVQGSFGYRVPAVVRSVIGGNPLGGATVTAPAQTATSGPLATGSAVTYTMSGTATSTAFPTQGASPGVKSSSSGINIGAIVAGVLAGLFFLLVLYLAFCLYVYRKQLALYKNHVAMAHRSHDSAALMLGAGLLPGHKKSGSDTREKVSSSFRASTDRQSANESSRGKDLSSNNPYRNVPGGAGYATAASSTEDLISGLEPTFLGVMLNPRRSLRVVNKD